MKSGILVNILFSILIVLYEFVFRALFTRIAGYPIEEVARRVQQEGASFPLLGGIILLAIIAESVGLFLKWRTSQIISATGRTLFIWSLHAAVTTAMTMTACRAFGVDITNLDAPSAVAVVANILKEVCILLLFLNKSTPRPSRPLRFAADACILFFYSISFATGWDALTASPDLNLYQYCSNPPMLVLNSFMAMVFFLMLYLPLRLGYFVTERMDTDRELLLFIFTTALVTAAALIPLYRPPIH